MKHYQPIITLALFLFLVNTKMGYAQTEPGLINAINKQALEITAFDTDDYSGLTAIGDILKDKKVIGLGEGTHGTREFFLYKSMLIKYLIRQYNLKLVLIESNMSGIDGLNDYVCNNLNMDLKTVIWRSSLFAIYQTQEVADLLTWIKTYNADKPQTDQVKFGGIDMHYTYFTVNDILKRKQFVALLTGEQKTALANLNKLWEKSEPQLSKTQKKYYLGIVKDMRQLVKEASIGDSSFIYNQDIRLLEQSILFNNLPDIPSNKIRDQFMAENIIWATRQTRAGDKVAVWAHNGHVSGGSWRGYHAMGFHLRQEYKDKYYALCLDVGEGFARLWNPRGKAEDRYFHKSPLPAIENTDNFEYVFKQAKYPNFFLNLKTQNLEEPVKKWIASPHFFRVAGALTVPSEYNVNLKINMKKSFDGVVFFRNTTNAQEMH
jgi:erythromycin esterase